MSKKLTPWFSPESRPVRVGMYQCRECTMVYSKTAMHFHYWNGREWRLGRNHILGEPLKNVTWRGLQKP